jgi:hypothetical protein
MATLTCEKCGGESAALDTCMGCSKKICRSCVKSQKKLHKLDRVAICRTCWGVMPKRRKFKAAR